MPQAAFSHFLSYGAASFPPMSSTQAHPPPHAHYRMVLPTVRDLTVSPILGWPVACREAETLVLDGDNVDPEAGQIGFALEQFTFKPYPHDVHVLLGGGLEGHVDLLQIDAHDKWPWRNINHLGTVKRKGALPALYDDCEVGTVEAMASHRSVPHRGQTLGNLPYPSTSMTF